MNEKDCLVSFKTLSDKELTEGFLEAKEILKTVEGVLVTQVSFFQADSLTKSYDIDPRKLLTRLRELEDISLENFEKKERLEREQIVEKRHSFINQILAKIRDQKFIEDFLDMQKALQVLEEVLASEIETVKRRPSSRPPDANPGELLRRIQGVEKITLEEFKAFEDSKKTEMLDQRETLSQEIIETVKRWETFEKSKGEDYFLKLEWVMKQLDSVLVSEIGVLSRNPGSRPPDANPGKLLSQIRQLENLSLENFKKKSDQERYQIIEERLQLFENIQETVLKWRGKAQSQSPVKKRSFLKEFFFLP